MTQLRTDDRLEAHAAELREIALRHGWRLVVLFGSVVRGGAGRDLDLAVLPGSMLSLLEQGLWQSELEALYAPRPVDLLLLGPDLSAVTRFQVFRDGRPLVEVEVERPDCSSASGTGPSSFTPTASGCGASSGRCSMALPDSETLDRKLGYLNRYLRDLGSYAPLDPDGTAGAASITPLNGCCSECAADIALQFLKEPGETLPASYREVFSALERAGALPSTMASDLIAACGMRNVRTHLYDDIDMDRVIAAVDPAIGLYAAFARWAIDRLHRAGPESTQDLAQDTDAESE